MHELSIALSILDLVALEAIKQKAHEVKEIELEVGHWAGVDISALSFSMRAVSAPGLATTKHSRVCF